MKRSSANLDLPVTAQVMEASSDVQYLGFKLEYTPSQILEVLSYSEIRVGSKENAKRGMFVSRMELSFPCQMAGVNFYSGKDKSRLYGVFYLQ
ncbi:hypothetical protein QF028_002320 [Neobacillus sp. B4I6]